MMKVRRIMVPCMPLLLPLAAIASGLEASFVDTAWNGSTVPDGHQCEKFGGNQGSPVIQVDGIPARANALVLEFSDGSYTPMDHGGHGKIGFVLDASARSAQIPSVPPHTSALPAGFWTIAEHGAPGWDTPGAYLPPCSGGRGNRYYVTVKAIERDGEEMTELAQTTLEMGKY